MAAGIGSVDSPSALYADGGPQPPNIKRPRRRVDLLPYALVTPLTLFIVGLALVPAAFTIVESFFRIQELNPPNTFTGLGNFQRLFSDGAVRASIGNTGLYVIIGVTISTVLAVMMAITLQHKFAGRSILIAVLILPWALPGVVEGIVWGSMWDSNTGFFNSLLTSVHLIDHYQVFLGQNRLLTIFAIELVQVWQITPLSTLLVLASLQNIPGELYESAKLDGCSSSSSFRWITLPLARPGITIAMVQAVIVTLNVFDQPYILNGAASTGATVTMQTYFISFQNLDFGEGYALSLLITAVTLLVSFVVLKLVYRPVEF
jgi:multiple sugar transport system permease protein